MHIVTITTTTPTGQLLHQDTLTTTGHPRIMHARHAPHPSITRAPYPHHAPIYSHHARITKGKHP
jgi:hypothetical protein